MILALKEGGGMELLNAVFWVMLIFSCSTHLPLLKAIFILSGGRRILCTVCRCPELLAMTRLLSCKWKQTMVHVAFTITFRIILLSIQIVLQIRTKCPDYLPPINIKFNFNLISQPAGRLFPPPQLWGMGNCCSGAQPAPKHFQARWKEYFWILLKLNIAPT